VLCHETYLIIYNCWSFAVISYGQENPHNRSGRSGCRQPEISYGRAAWAGPFSGLLQDVHLIEKLAHIDCERIPERVVHAKGANAHGDLQGIQEHGREYQGEVFAGSKEEDPGLAADGGVGRSPCSNTLTIAAVGATVREVGKGIFKASQWIKPYNDGR
jgi:hypothetical protein